MHLLEIARLTTGDVWKPLSRGAKTNVWQFALSADGDGDRDGDGDGDDAGALLDNCGRRVVVPMSALRGCTPGGDVAESFI